MCGKLSLKSIEDLNSDELTRVLLTLAIKPPQRGWLN